MQYYAVLDAFATARSSGGIAVLNIGFVQPIKTYKAALLELLGSAMQRMGSYKWSETKFTIHYMAMDKKPEVISSYEQAVEAVFNAKEDSVTGASEICRMEIETSDDRFVWAIRKFEV
jgi:hypothetical protein